MAQLPHGQVSGPWQARDTTPLLQDTQGPPGWGGFLFDLPLVLPLPQMVHIVNKPIPNTLPKPRVQLVLHVLLPNGTLTKRVYLHPAKVAA